MADLCRTGFCTATRSFALLVLLGVMVVQAGTTSAVADRGMRSPDAPAAGRQDAPRYDGWPDPHSDFEAPYDRPEAPPASDDAAPEGCPYKGQPLQLLV